MSGTGIMRTALFFMYISGIRFDLALWARGEKGVISKIAELSVVLDCFEQ
jgi:hypothetical protein